VSIERLEVVHRTDERFYELLVDGKFGGLIVYGNSGTRVVFTHTFIADGFRGRGLSNVLIKGVLDDLTEHGMTMTNYCPVLDRFLEKNPQYVGLVDPQFPGMERDQADGAANDLR
jgi:predicted GNAT family acetyltransferase